MYRSSALLGIAFMGTCGLSVGCESSDGRHVERTRTVNGDVVVAHDRDYGDRARANVSRDIPDTAREVRSVSGHDAVTYRPDRSGMVYVNDASSGMLMWAGRVDRDQRFTLDPADGSVKLDGQRVVERKMDADHTYRIYFDPTSSR